MGMNMSIFLSTLSDCKCSGNFKLISVKNLHLTLYAQSIMYGVTVESLSKSQLKTPQSFIKPVFMCWVFQKGRLFITPISPILDVQDAAVLHHFL